jgi:hypothetical protein
VPIKVRDSEVLLARSRPAASASIGFFTAVPMNSLLNRTAEGELGGIARSRNVCSLRGRKGPANSAERNMVVRFKGGDLDVAVIARPAGPATRWWCRVQAPSSP